MKKAKFRFNILDLLILVVILLCIAGALLRGGVKTTDEKLETQTAVISYFISNVQSASQHCFQEGDPIYSHTLGCDLGHLVGKVQVEPSVYFVEDDGKIIKTVSDAGRVDIRGQFEAEGKMSESGFAIGGTQYIAPGLSTYAFLPNINVTILITDVTLKDE